MSAEKQDADLLNRLGITAKMRRRMLRSVQRLVDRLTDRQILKEPVSSITEADVCNLCYLLPDTLLNEPVCLTLTLEKPIYVIGDLRGQFTHLIHLLNTLGHPPETHYLFLGNYADYGEKSIETLALLFAYKLLHPQSVYLLRGKHECDAVGRVYGLFDLCLKRFTRRMWHDITAVFTYLPVAALLDDQILCIHGGLSPLIEFSKVCNPTDLKTQLCQTITRPAVLDRNSILTHLIWSDPDEDTVNWEQNPIGMGYLFGPGVVTAFCDRLGITQIIRSSEMVSTGYAFFKDPRILTIFSAPDFASQYGNDGAVVQLFPQTGEEMRGKIKIMKPIIRLRCKQTTRINVLFEEVTFELGKDAAIV
ncbi:Serine/threonine-protein phosphatase [Paragonimus heterotremus]|uniref:Serine/threonine-protein phosphatase n=1 Tax=Paragonimus heterotremus TaxID=100268 RepID=A0A8J4TIY7_9TREM|nr:Serine/threonine-protein phosphatase [Paragonimus heterotremus]